MKVTNNQIRRWEKIRKLGRIPFVSIVGAILIGLIALILYPLVACSLIQGIQILFPAMFPQPKDFAELMPSVTWYIIRLPGFLALGGFVGRLIWEANEQKYKTLKG